MSTNEASLEFVFILLQAFVVKHLIEVLDLAVKVCQRPFTKCVKLSYAGYLTRQQKKVEEYERSDWMQP